MSAAEAEKWRNKPKPGMPLFEGPEDIREEFIKSKGIDWTASYIDPAAWIDSTKTLVTATGVAFDRIQQGASKLCAFLNITVREGGERVHQQEIQGAYERSTGARSRPFAHRDAAE